MPFLRDFNGALPDRTPDSYSFVRSQLEQEILRLTTTRHLM